MNTTRRRNRKNSACDYQKLEHRRCLAGNISVVVDGSTLLITGDAESNEIVIAPSEQNDRILISGIETTVNGQDSVNVQYRFRNIRFQLNGGNDRVTAAGLTTSKTIDFFGGEGDDQFNFQSGRSRYLHIDSGSGNDTVNLGNVVTNKSAYMYLREGNDVVAIDSLAVGRNLKVFAGEGEDTFVSNTLNVGRKFKLNLDEGNDSVLFTGQTDVSKKAKVDLGAGDDSLLFQPQQANQNLRTKKLKVFGSDGNDNIAIDGNVNIRRKAKIDGGDGTDNLQNDQTLNDTKVVSIEDNTVDIASIRDSVFTRLRELEIDTSLFGDQTERTIAVTTSTNDLQYTEGDEATAIDDAITLTSDSELSVTQARVSLSDFDPSQDLLAFEDSDSVLGQFNATTGVMTLSPSEGTSGTLAEFQAALQAVTYENSSDAPNTSNRTFTFEVDSDDQTFSGTRNLDVEISNSLPAIELSQSTRTAPANQLPFVLDALLDLSDADDTEFESASVSIVGGLNAEEDELSFTADPDVAADYDSESGTLSISGDLSQATLEEFLRSVTFDNTAETSIASSRTIRFTVSDAEGSFSEDLTLNITVDAEA